MDFELPVLAPSILAADFSKLGEEIHVCTEAGISWIHCDIMDGHFVPNISYGPQVVATARRSAPEAFLDVHLMIEKPDDFMEAFADAGADLITVHYEACPHLHRTVENIRSHGCMTGIAVNPATPVHLLKPMLPLTDLVLIMSVNPGFGGQMFIKESHEKIRELAQLRKETQGDFLIEVDGGVGPGNIQNLVKMGADVLVAGSSIFKVKDRSSRLAELQKLANLGRKYFV